MRVKIYESISDENKLIYEGALKEYENGAWSNIDFGAIYYLIIFDWNSEAVVYIFPDEATAKFADKSDISYLTEEKSAISVASQMRINGIDVGENGMRIIDNSDLNCDFVFTNNSSKEQIILINRFTVRKIIR